MHTAPEDEHQTNTQVFAGTGSARLSASKPQHSGVEKQREEGIPRHLQLVGPKTYRRHEKQHPSARLPRSQFDQKKSCARHAGHHQHLEAESAKKRVAKIKRNIPQPLPPQLAPKLGGIPWRKIKTRQIRRAPFLHQPLPERHMPPRIGYAYLPERNGEKSRHQSQPPKRGLEPLRRLPGSGCFLFHALNAYPKLAKNPYQIFSILPTSEVANFEHPWKTTSVVPDRRSIFPFTAHDSMDSESFC